MTEKKNGNGAKRFTQQIEVELSHEERADRGRELAELLEEERRVKQAAKDAAAEYKDTLAGIRDRATPLRTACRTGLERRAIECEARRNDKEGSIEVVRLDTAEVIDRRAMTAEERQGELDLSNKTKGAGKTKGKKKAKGADDGATAE